MSGVVLLPYYYVSAVDARGGGRAGFWGEAAITPRLPVEEAFLLAMPRDPGFLRVPGGGERILEPLLDPSGYGDYLSRATEEIHELALGGGSSFDYGGLTGLLKMIVRAFGFGGGEGVKPTRALEARLAYDFLHNILGVPERPVYSVSTTVYWLPLRVEGSRILLPGGGRFRVLERLASRHKWVARALAPGTPTL